ncbi:MAG: TM2 domain-containing protein [Succinivibrio sp.]
MSDTNAQQSPKTVNKIAYALLAFFFGQIGVHMFYAGKTVKGILFILATIIGFLTTPFVIGSVILLIEFVIIIIQIIVAIAAKADENGRITVK